MERPQAEAQSKQREITGEIVYLDEMRRSNESPKPFLELGDMAIQMYEATADMYPEDQRPAIMDEYEQHDPKPSEVVASCTLLADELLKLKEPESPFTFVDIAVDADPDTVLARLAATSAGSVMAGDDEQLAIESDGEYYPVLDIRKRTARLVGIGLRIWGWDYDKCVFTNKEGEPYKYPQHALHYPSYEKSSSKQIELSFGYTNKEPGGFSESISLHLSPNGSASINSSIWVPAYAETGYEGHGGSFLREPTDDDIAAFGDLVAEIVGDNPESVKARMNHRLQKLTNAAASPSAKQAIHGLIEATWPAQANYFLSRKLKGAEQTLAEQLQSEATADAAAAAVNTIVEKWKAAGRTD